MLGRSDDAALDVILAHAGHDADCSDPMVELRQLGGALARQPARPRRPVPGWDCGDYTR
jgi:hypothetical protein